MKNHHVIVLGAGVAGLSASQGLTEAGYKVTVLEGRDRIGGRILTQQTPNNATVELGANWREANAGNPVMEQDFGLAFEASPYTDCIAFDGMQQLTEVQQLLKQVAAITEDIYTNASQYINKKPVTLAQAFNDSVARLASDLAISESQLKQVRFIFTLYHGAQEGKSLDQIPVMRFYRNRAAGGYNLPEIDTGLRLDDTPHLVTNGYDRVPKGLLEKCKSNPGDFSLLRQHKVTAIATQAGKVKITCQTPGGEKIVEGDDVICTLPLGVMQQLIKGNKITPPLAANQANALNGMKMGVLNKVVLQFPHCFWDPASHYTLLQGKDDNGHLAMISIGRIHRQANTVVLHYFGQAAKFDSSQSNAAIVADVMKQLRATYGDHIPNPNYQQVTRWHEDEFALGSYTSPAVGEDPDSQFYASQHCPSRHLWFAGEHISPYIGTVHGAYVSGMQAAEGLRVYYEPDYRQRQVQADGHDGSDASRRQYFQRIGQSSRKLFTESLRNPHKETLDQSSTHRRLDQRLSLKPLKPKP